MNVLREWYDRYISVPQVVILGVLLVTGFVVMLTLGQMLAPVLAGVVIAYLLDGVVEKCSEMGSCDHAYFTRALIGLYERRDIAEKCFEKVIALDPKSQLAASSKAWMLLLQRHPAPASVSWLDAIFGAPAIANTNSALVKATDRLVRDLLEWEGNVQTVEYLQRDASLI